jgi:hypothetical protein
MTTDVSAQLNQYAVNSKIVNSIVCAPLMPVDKCIKGKSSKA